MSPKPIALVLLSIASLAVSACGIRGADVPTDQGCRWTRPISWSEKDTDETARQVRGHNAARGAVCGNDVPPPAANGRATIAQRS